LLAEIRKLQDTPVSTAELEKAKNQIITDQLRQRETSNGKALALGEAAVLLGDPARVNTDLARLQAVTAADVQRVMKKYFADQNRLVLYYLPEATKQAQRGAPKAEEEDQLEPPKATMEEQRGARDAPKARQEGSQGLHFAAPGIKEKRYRPEGPTETGGHEVRK
jgi:zinc protease